MWIARSLPLVIRRALRGGLHGVWGRELVLPEGGCVVAANHHSWWDGYLLWLVQQRVKRPAGLMMEAEQLARFRFFRRLGVVSPGELRLALTRIGRGEVWFLFPEGALRPAGRVGSFHNGAAFLAQRAGVLLYPLALRVVMRGAQHPEAFVVLGEAVDTTGDRQSVTARCREAIDGLLHEIDETLLSNDPERPPPGFDAWLSGPGSFHERVGWVARLWQ